MGTASTGYSLGGNTHQQHLSDLRHADLLLVTWHGRCEQADKLKIAKTALSQVPVACFGRSSFRARITGPAGGAGSLLETQCFVVSRARKRIRRHMGFLEQRCQCMSISLGN